MPMCQQERTSLFSQSSNYSTGLSQIPCGSQQSRQPISSQGSSQGRSRDSGVITQQPQKTANRQIRPKKTAWESYLATKPLTGGEANCSRLVSSRRHSIEVSFFMKMSYKNHLRQ